MIIWTGYGFLVAVFVFLSALMMEYVTESVFKDDQFYQQTTWPMALALGIAGLFCFFVGLALNVSGERRLIDPDTGEDVIIETGHHSLFFVKMHWWGRILLVIAVVTYVYRVLEANSA